MITRECGFCCKCEVYEVDALDRCAACLGTKIETVEVCDGCDEHMNHCGPLGLYLVTFHDGGSCEVYYCVDCVDLAKMDWNGETKSIERREPCQP